MLVSLHPGPLKLLIACSIFITAVHEAALQSALTFAGALCRVWTEARPWYISRVCVSFCCAHSTTETQTKGAFSVLTAGQSDPCVTGLSAVSHRGRSHPDAQTGFSVPAHLPASHTNHSSRLPASPGYKEPTRFLTKAHLTLPSSVVGLQV